MDKQVVTQNMPSRCTSDFSKIRQKQGEIRRSFQHFDPRVNMVTEDAVRQHVATAIHRADLNTVSAQQIREIVETQLSLEKGTLSTDKWKVLINLIILPCFSYFSLFSIFNTLSVFTPHSPDRRTRVHHRTHPHPHTQ